MLVTVCTWHAIMLDSCAEEDTEWGGIADRLGSAWAGTRDKCMYYVMGDLYDKWITWTVITKAYRRDVVNCSLLRSDMRQAHKRYGGGRW